MRIKLRAVYSHNYGENRLVGSKQDVEEELQVVHLVIQATSYCVNDQSQLVGTKQDVEEEHQVLHLIYLNLGIFLIISSKI